MFQKEKNEKQYDREEYQQAKHQSDHINIKLK